MSLHTCRLWILLAFGLLAEWSSACSSSFWLGEYSLSGAPGWTRAGMIQARRAHRATLLADGRVLVTGGASHDQNAIDVFEPALGAWHALGTMKAKRWNHTATLLADGRVFIYGGRDGFGAVDSAEIFDPATGQSVLGDHPTAEWHTEVASHTATRLRDGRVLVAGGSCAQSSCGAYARAWIFDPVEHPPGGVIKMQARPDMCVPREQHTASPLADGTVLVVGGLDDRLYAIATVERFVPGTDRWASAPAMFWARGRHTATTLLDGRILVTGGHGARNLHPGERLDCAPVPPPPSGYRVPAFPPPGYPSGPPPRPRPAPPPEPYQPFVTIASAELYDPATDTWVEVAPMHRAREQHSAALLPDGRVLVSGGYIDDPRHCEEIDQSGMETAEIWDPRTNVWTMTPPMAMYRVDHSSTPLPDGRILLVGGGGGDAKQRLDPVEIWPPPVDQ